MIIKKIKGYFLLIVLSLATQTTAKGIYDDFLKSECFGFDATKGKDDIKKGINPEKLKFFEKYILDQEIVDEQGNKIKTSKGSFFGKAEESGEGLGERVFDFDKMIQDFSKASDQLEEACLAGLISIANEEWNQHLNQVSTEYGCGVELKSQPVSCSIREAKELKDCRKVTGENELKPSQERFPYEAYELNKDDAKVSDKCAKAQTKTGESLRDFLTSRMSILENLDKKMFSAYIGKIKTQIAAMATAAEANAKKEGQKAGTEGKPACLDPRGCAEKSDTQELVQAGKETTEKAKEQDCCNYLSDNWTTLGLSTVRGSTPNARICKEMMDPSSEKSVFSAEFAEQCTKNFAAALTKSAVNSFVDFFSFGWLTNIPMLIKELTTNFSETIAKIGKEIIGLDEKVYSCVNEPTRNEMICSMVGNFFGNNVGFGAAMGGVIGGSAALLGKSAKLGNIGLKKFAGKESKILTQMSKSQLASKGLFRSTSAGVWSGAKNGFLLPIHAGKATFGVLGYAYKGVRSGVKLATVPLTAGAAFGIRKFIKSADNVESLAGKTVESLGKYNNKTLQTYRNLFEKDFYKTKSGFVTEYRKVGKEKKGLDDSIKKEQEQMDKRNSDLQISKDKAEAVIKDTNEAKNFYNADGTQMKFQPNGKIKYKKEFERQKREEISQQESKVISENQAAQEQIELLQNRARELDGKMANIKERYFNKYAEEKTRAELITSKKEIKRLRDENSKLTNDTENGVTTLQRNLAEIENLEQKTKALTQQLEEIGKLKNPPELKSNKLLNTSTKIAVPMGAGAKEMEKFNEPEQTPETRKFQEGNDYVTPPSLIAPETKEVTPENKQMVPPQKAAEKPKVEVVKTEPPKQPSGPQKPQPVKESTEKIPKPPPMDR
ncbi:MAG: hypothetical protein HUU56_06955 [Bdellovibrionaceae bacterium]|nr:hypothetical protein [Pseudobdellovibrionaceae bacterium]